jgi:hypothetical protein
MQIDSAVERGGGLVLSYSVVVLRRREVVLPALLRFLQGRLGAHTRSRPPEPVTPNSKGLDEFQIAGAKASGASVGFIVAPWFGLAQFRRSARMRRFVPISLASLLAISIMLPGCIYSRRPGPYIVRLHLDTKTPELYRIRLASGEPREFSPDAQGRVSFTLSPVRQGRDWYWFGLGRLTDGSGWGDPVIHVLKEESVVQKLSLREINKLPVVAPADHLLKLDH